MRRVLLLACLYACLAVAPLARAGSVALLLGPATAGTGGSNPLGIPPDPVTDVAVKIVTDSGFESSLSVVPGLFFGQRFREDNWYVSVGGGLIGDPNSIGFGFYSALGYVSGKGAGLHFNAEYEQTLGIGGTGFVAPVAVRLGALWEY